jgi:hypothetical protein
MLSVRSLSEWMDVCMCAHCHLQKRSKKFEKTTANHAIVQNKISNIKNFSKKAEVSLVNAKSKMQAAGLELCFKLNELQVKRKFQLLQSMCHFMNRSLTFFTTASTAYQSMQSTSNELSEALIQRRRAIEERQQSALSNKRHTISIAMGSLIDSNKTTKQGYLFKRKRGGYHHNWEKRFYVVSDGMMLEKNVCLFTRCFSEISRN